MSSRGDTRSRLDLALLTHEPFYPPSGGGSAEAVYLVREFVRRGHRVHVFCPAIPESAAVEERFGIRIHPFTRWAMGRYTSLRSLKYLAYPFFLERLVARVAAVTPFTTVLSQHAISAVAAGRLRRRLGVPVVMNQLDYLTGFMQTWPPWLMPPPVLRRLMQFEVGLPRRYAVEGVLTVSDPLADHVAGAGFPRERIRPMYYGYDAALFPFDAGKVAAQASARPVVVMHGSFDHHHLGPIALEALVRVRAAWPDVTFRFVGRATPTLQRFLAEARRRGVEGGCETTGFVPYDAMASRLADATVGIVPYEESAGVHCAFVAKAVEYLAVGLPVVSTPLRGLQRYFGDEPLLRFGRFDGRDFGDRILTWLATDPAERARLAVGAAERVRRELDWPVICRRAVDFVEQTVCR